MKKSRSKAAEALALAAAGLLLLVFAAAGKGVQTGSRHFYTALAITIGFAAAARAVRGVDTGGAISGGVVAFILASRDLRLFWVLLTVFVLTLAATRWGRSRKKQLKVAEAEAGRTAAQVMANLGLAALVLALPPFDGSLLLATAALAEVASDTTSSELGTAFPGHTVLITTLEPVAPGVDGGVSVIGTLAGVLAACAIAGSAALLQIISLPAAAIVACAGSAGMLGDSVFGAAFERRGYLNNHHVNLIGTGVAIGIAWLVKGIW